MSYVDAIFERYWEERLARAHPRIRPQAPRWIQDGRAADPFDDRRETFCLEVERAVLGLDGLERSILWRRQPPPGEEPMAWRAIAKELRLSHSVPQRIYRRAARRLAEEFRARGLRPLRRAAEPAPPE